MSLYKNQRDRPFTVFGKMEPLPLHCCQHGSKSCRLLRTHSWCLVHRPRYSATNTARILVRFSTVGRCMFSSVSSRVCQNFGKGVLMRCNTGTPWRVWRIGRRTIFVKPSPQEKLWFGLDSALTFVKEGDVVILHRPKVEVFPEICLLWGVRRQKTLSMEPLLCAPGVEGRIRRGALLIRTDEVTFGAYLQQPGGQTSALCSESDLQSVDLHRRANPAAQRGPGNKRLKIRPINNAVSILRCPLLKMHWFHHSLLNSAHLTTKSFNFADSDRKTMIWMSGSVLNCVLFNKSRWMFAVYLICFKSQTKNIFGHLKVLWYWRANVLLIFRWSWKPPHRPASGDNHVCWAARLRLLQH